MTKREKKRFLSDLVSLIPVALFLYVSGIILYSSYIGLGTFGQDYSFGFALLIIYTTIAMGSFTCLRIWILKNKKYLIKRGIIQLSFMWLMSIMYIGVGVSLPAHFAILNTINPIVALIVAVVAATDFWIIENTTRTTVDILTDPSLQHSSRNSLDTEEETDQTRIVSTQN